MKRDSGLGKVYLENELYAEVQYNLTFRTTRTGQEEIKGTITVGEGGPDFLDTLLIYNLELEDESIYPFWVKNPHPAVLDPLYKIVVAPQ